jgi:hypothetical protein
MAHRLDQSTCAIPQGGHGARFFTNGFFIPSNIKKPTKEDPVISVLDGQYSHTRNLVVITSARENHLPPTSQQPQNATLG